MGARPNIGLMRSLSVSSAGKSKYVATQHSVMPMPPIAPKCLKPRKLVTASDP